jgi:hypothetical protein
VVQQYYVDYTHSYRAEHSSIVLIPCMKNILRYFRTNPHCPNPFPTDTSLTPAKLSTLQDCTISPGCEEITQMSWWPWAGCMRSFEGMKKWFQMMTKSRFVMHSDQNVISMSIIFSLEVIIARHFIMFSPLRISSVLLGSTGSTQRTCLVWSTLFCSTYQCSCRTPWRERRTLS